MYQIEIFVVGIRYWLVSDHVYENHSYLLLFEKQVYFTAQAHADGGILTT